ncbi:hypothetical protein [Xanthomonas phage XPP9]|nr:hypothetical protein [Xanthomonas phage XPP9]AVO24287.1 hypothetical protein [Xanthomonas phage XPV2]UUR56246.1 hypothetical protein [Xanthomonas phage pXoo2107]
MSIQVVPLAPRPNQSLSVVLGGNDVHLTLRTLADTTYLDVIVGTTPVAVGRMCLDRIDLTPRARYLGIGGLSLCFADLRGRSAPVWTDFGTRYVLLNVAQGLASSDASGSRALLTYDGSSTYDGLHTYGGAPV